MSDAEWMKAHLAALAAKDPRYAKLIRPDGTIISPPPVEKAPPPRLPCIHEESVMESCKTCSGATAEGRHVRGCAIHDKCTRLKVSGKVKACESCAEYSSGRDESRTVEESQ